MLLAAIDVGAILTSILQASASWVVPLLCSGLVALGGLLGRWLHAHTGTSKVLGALATGADYVGTAVAHVMEGLRPKFEAALANDGKIDAAELADLKAAAMTLILAEMPASMKTISSALGPAFQTWLSGKVSQAVTSQAEQLANLGAASADAQTSP